MRTVLLTRFSAIGDVAIAVPVVYSACRCYPQTRFVLLTRPTMVPIFADAPANLCVAGVDLKDGYKGVGGIYRLASRILEEYAPAVYLDLQNEMRTRLLAAFLRLRGVPGFRIDKGSRLRRRLTRRHNKLMLPLRGKGGSHYRNQQLAVLSHLHNCIGSKADHGIGAEQKGRRDGSGSCDVTDFFL